MNAIVLSCDRYRRLAEHMIAQYARLWPDHPFMFRVGAQEIPRISPARTVFQRCPTPIKATVLSLVEDLSDEEWVYWCIDDKYPIWLDLPAARAAHAWTQACGPEVAGVLICRCRDLLRKRFLGPTQRNDGAGNVFLERLGYEQIWLHQWLRVGALRRLFAAFPNEISQPKLMDDWKKSLLKPRGDRLFVTRRNRAVFGESTSRGVLTQNCAENIRDFDLKLPEWFDGKLAPARTMGARPRHHPLLGFLSKINSMLMPP